MTTTIGDELLRDLAVGISNVLNDTEKGVWDVDELRPALLHVERTSQLLRPSAYGLERPGDALSLLGEMRDRDGDDPVLERLAFVLEGGVKLSEALDWPSDPDTMFEIDHDTAVGDREQTYTLFADASASRGNTIIGIADDRGVPFQGLAAARGYTHGRAEKMMADDPDRDWSGWTWTAHVWVKGAGGADERVEMCRLRVGDDNKSVWEREAPDRRYSVRVAGEGDAAVWLDLHTGRESDAPNPFVDLRMRSPRERDADRVAAPREKSGGGKDW